MTRQSRAGEVDKDLTSGEDDGQREGGRRKAGGRTGRGTCFGSTLLFLQCAFIGSARSDCIQSISNCHIAAFTTKDTPP